MIEIKNITKRYENNVALQNLNLIIKEESIFGLIGVNGAGKSTLLRLLSGVLHPDEGEILFDNKPIYENEKIKQELFFLPDDPFYSLGTTGKQLKEFYSSFYNFNNETFNYYIDEFKLDINTSINTFSKGMRRQLFVCMAFAISPKYLFLDEVFDGLDPSARLILKKGLIDLINKNKGIIIMASHSLKELEDICDSFGLFENKAITKSGSINEALDGVYKFQIAFDKKVEKENLGFDYLSFEASGRIIKVVVRGNKEEYLKKIKELNPLIIDEVAVDFEEFFISEVGE